MNKLTIATSMITLILLSFFSFDSDNQISKNDKGITSKAIHEISMLDKNQLEIEKEWLALQALSDLEKQKKILAKQPESNSNAKSLTIGGNDYNLLGIFIAQSESFILISPKLIDEKTNQKANMMKILQGQEITAGITLGELTSDKITLKSTEGTFEFKLFERNSNDTL